MFREPVDDYRDVDYGPTAVFSFRKQESSETQPGYLPPCPPPGGSVRGFLPVLDPVPDLQCSELARASFIGVNTVTLELVLLSRLNSVVAFGPDAALSKMLTSLRNSVIF
ncbi:hypothetical protein EMCRGX_G033277 [Ephydatia muelleri]